MALAVAPTPFLTGKDAERFDRIVEEGLQNKVRLELRPVDWSRIHTIQNEIAANTPISSHETFSER